MKKRVKASAKTARTSMESKPEPSPVKTATIRVTEDDEHTLVEFLPRPGRKG